MPSSDGPARPAAGFFERLRSSKLLPFVVLAVSLTATGILWRVLENQTTERAQTELESEARLSVAALAEELLGYEEVMQVLSDETMPGMTGSQLAEEIAASRPDLPLILMSGYAGATLAARARAVGAHEVLSKPLQSRDIGCALANALGKTN